MAERDLKHSDSARRRERMADRLVREIVPEGFQKLSRFREKRKEYLRLYAGSHYGAFDKGEDVPVNPLHRTLHALVANIVGSEPACTVSPRTSASLLGYSRLLSFLTTEDMARLRIRDKERRNFLNACMFAGVMRVGLEPDDEDGYREDTIGYGGPGSVCVDVVDPDDFVIDPIARSWEEARFVGERFRVTRRRLLSLGVDKDTVLGLPQWGGGPIERDGEPDQPGVEPMDEMVELMELWCRGGRDGFFGRDPVRLIAPSTIGSLGSGVAAGTRGKSVPWMRLIDDEGPDEGPYCLLGFRDVPGSPMPTAPANFMRDLAVMNARLVEKMVESACTYRNVLLGKKGNEDELAQIGSLPDSGMGTVDDPDTYRSFEIGGAPDKTVGTIGVIQQLVSDEGGNADVLTGLGNSRGGNRTTATEVRDTAERVGARMRDMEERFYLHSDEVCRKMAFWTSRDPLLDRIVDVPVGKHTFQFRVTPELMPRGKWLERNLEIRRGSYHRMSDRERNIQRMQLVANILPLAVQVSQATGGQIAPQDVMLFVTEGEANPADIERLFGVGGIGQMLASGRPASGGGEMRKPGMPGTPGIKGSIETGAQSAKFDTGKVAAGTVEGMGYG